MANEASLSTIFTSALNEHIRTIEALRQQRTTLELIGERMAASIRSGGKVLWCGNGGSAADSQHLAAEFVGRFRGERRPLPSIALTTDSSVLTAVANDYGYDEVFSRQVEALCVSGDVLVGISTSGRSTNVVKALEMARKVGAFTAALTGAADSPMSRRAHTTVHISSAEPARIQEAHILCGHILCDWVETACCSG